MRRGSLVFPLILIVIGVLFLLNNFNPELRVFTFAGRYWPFLLIGWGALRAVEILASYQRGAALPQSGITGGEWFIAIFIALIGGGFASYSGFADGRWANRVTVRGLEVFGESFDFPLSATVPVTGASRMVVDNLRGNTRIVAGDVDQVQVTGRTTVRAYDESTAREINEKTQLEVVQEAGQIIVRTNQAKATSGERISSDLDIVAPKGFTIECRGRYGDFDVSGFTGDIDIRSDNAGVRLEEIGGGVRLDLGRSDIVRATNVKGNIDIKGRGSDLDLENIAGTVTVIASYYGDLQFRNIAKQMRYESNNSTVTFERIPGYVRFSRGDLTAARVAGPVRIKSNSKDVRLSELTGSLEVDVRRGDIEVFPGTTQFDRMNLRTGNGDIELGLVENSKLSIEAQVRRGEIRNDFADSLRIDKEDRGATLKGAVGQGPEVKLDSGRGSIVIRKAAAGSPDWDAKPGFSWPDPPTPPRAPRAPRVINQ
jgi:DUF4097 and DUF4098 domain-containing protein YvlB